MTKDSTIEVPPNNNNNNNNNNNITINGNQYPSENQPLLLSQQQQQQSQQQSQQQEDIQPKWGLYNVIVMGFAFLLLFTGFNTSSSYLTTAMPKNVGLYSLSILYATFTLANFVSAAIVKQIGPRISMIIAAIMYLLFLAAAAIDVIPLYLAASGLCGFGAAVLWTAQGSFITNNSAASKMSFHSGLFFGILQLNGIIGYPIAATFVSSGKSFSLIFSVLVTIAAAGVGLMFILRRVEIKQGAKKDSVTQLFVSMLLLFKDPRILALVFLVLYSGFSAAFFSGVFPLTMDKEWIAWTSLCFAGAEVLGSLAAGRLAGYIGRIPIIGFFFVTHAATLASVYASQLYHFTPYYFAATSLFGLADSCAQVTMYAILGNMFADRSEYAFSYFKFVQSLGYTISFLIAVPLQHHVIYLVYILSGILLAALVGMIVLCSKLADINYPPKKQ